MNYLREKARSDDYRSIVKRTNEINLKQQEMLHKTTSIIEAQNALLLENKRNEEILNNTNEKQQSLLHSSIENLDLLHNTFKQITGGDSKPFVNFGLQMNDSDKNDSVSIQFSIVNKGEFPIRNLMVSVSNNVLNKIASDSKTTTAITGSSSVSVGFVDIKSPWAPLIKTENLIGLAKELGSIKLESKMERQIVKLVKGSIKLGDIPSNIETDVFEYTFPNANAFFDYTILMIWLTGNCQINICGSINNGEINIKDVETLVGVNPVDPKELVSIKKIY